MAHFVLTMPERYEESSRATIAIAQLTSIEHHEARQRLQTDKGSCGELPGVITRIEPVGLGWPARDVCHNVAPLGDEFEKRKQKNGRQRRTVEMVKALKESPLRTRQDIGGAEAFQAFPPPGDPTGDLGYCWCCASFCAGEKGVGRGHPCLSVACKHISTSTLRCWC